MSIQKKLLEFHKLGIKIEKSAVNPYFKSKYATLNEVLDKVKEPLLNLGVVIIQRPTIEGLVTEIFDTESNTSITGLVPYKDIETAQKLGIFMTYIRRYSVVTMLGLEDEDTDGNVPVVQVKKPVVAKPVPQAPQAKVVTPQAKVVTPQAKDDLPF